MRSWSEPAAAPMQQAERSAWSALLDPAAAGKKGGLLPAARALIQASQRQGVPVSQRLLARLLSAAAGEARGREGCAGLRGLPPAVPARPCRRRVLRVAPRRSPCSSAQPSCGIAVPASWPHAHHPSCSTPGHAERRQWDCVEELVAAQHPGSLAAAPGLLPALAEGHQYPLLQLLLAQVRVGQPAALALPVQVRSCLVLSLAHEPG